jgi:hypothetical protein
MSGLGFNRMMAGLLFTAIVLTACLMPAQSDTYWHLRAGQEIWRTHHVPLVETWSHTAAGRFWPNHEWLWQAVSYGLYRLGGMPLLSAGAAAIVAAAFALAYRMMVGAPVTRFVLMVLGVPICACVWALRPQIVSLALLALLVTLLVRERHRWLPLLFVLWANVHGAVALGVAVLAAAAALAVVTAARSRQPDDKRRAMVLAVNVPIAAALTALTPMGTRLWSFIAESIHRSQKTVIAEWMPAYPNGPVEIAFWVLALAFVVLLWKRWRRLDTWSDRVSVLAAVVVLPLAIRAVRNIPPFLLLAVPAASRLLGPDFRFGRREASADAAASVDHPRLNLAILALLVLLGAGTVGVAWAAPLPMLGWRPLSPGVIAAVRACPGPLYNRYNEGGYLIWFVPERPVFIDSRQDPYPFEFVYETVSNDSHATVDDTFARYGIRCAMLPTESETIPRLRAKGWRESFSDREMAVLVPGGSAAPGRPFAPSPARP